MAVDGELFVLGGCPSHSLLYSSVQQTVRRKSSDSVQWEHIYGDVQAQISATRLFSELFSSPNWRINTAGTDVSFGLFCTFSTGRFSAERHLGVCVDDLPRH